MFKTDKPILNHMDEFLANKDVSENTRKKYREALHAFIFWLTRNAKDVRDPKRAEIIEYKNYLLRSKRATTVDLYMSAVRQFFGYLEQIGEHENIAIGIHSPKKYRGFRKDPVPAEKIHHLLKVIGQGQDKLINLRNYAIINLMVHTGMRCCEVTRANVADLKKDKDQWSLRIQGKGHYEKDREIYLTKKVIAPILEYIKMAGLQNDSPLFINHAYISQSRITTHTISTMVKRYLRKIEIDSPRISAHSLRHTAAMTALSNGADIFSVQAMLGHSSPETTMVYLRSLEEQKRRMNIAIKALENAF